MRGLMQDRPLSLPLLMPGLEGRFSRKTVTTGLETTTYDVVAERIRRLTTALEQLHIPRSARVGSFGWNTQRHLELYMAVPCSNRILHTINHRLFGDDIVYIVNDAEDDVLFADRSMLDVVWPLIDRFTTVRHLIVMDDGPGPAIPDDPRVIDYEDLVGSAPPAASLDVSDERTAAALCYTSGTTGRPKGVLYDHRSIVLHAMSLLTADAFAISEADVVMPIVPMFHGNAWGLPYAAIMAGASLALPGAAMHPAALADMIATARVTFVAAVPAIWRNLLPHLHGRDLSALRRLVSGGSALPDDLARTAGWRSGGFPTKSSCSRAYPEPGRARSPNRFSGNASPHRLTEDACAPALPISSATDTTSPPSMNAAIAAASAPVLVDGIQRRQPSACPPP